MDRYKLQISLDVEYVEADTILSSPECNPWSEVRAGCQDDDRVTKQ